MLRPIALCVLTVLALASACGERPTATCDGDFAAEDGDFDCILSWPVVDGVRVMARCGGQTSAEELIRHGRQGDTFPVGTMLSRNAFEAMVKRRAGFDPTHNDWEYFAVSRFPGGAHITARGTSEPTNTLGNCRDCHSKARDFDYVCLNTHGCGDLPAHRNVIAASQELDALCGVP